MLSKERTFKMKPYTTFLTILLILFSSVAFAERLAVSSATANIRSGPGTKNKILFSVDKGIPFKILKKKGKWIHIQHADGDKGWIHKSLVW